MSTHSNDDKARPKPKGQKKSRRKSGARKKRPRPENTVELIDRHLLEKIPMTINGKSKRVTVLAAIALHLVQKELAGDAYASCVLLKYQALAKRGVDKQVDLEFVDDDRARSVAASLSEGRHD